MLRRQPSLALRAGIVFVSIYVAVFLGCLILLSLSTLSSEESNHIGPDIAIALADDEIERSGGQLHLRPGGRFERFALAQPSLWLLAERGGARLEFGRVPSAARGLFEQERGRVRMGEFQIPGAPPGLADASMERHGDGPDPLWIAAGGVDPDRLSLVVAATYFLTEGFGLLLVIFLVTGVAATLLALPLVTMAVRPASRAAAAIRIDDPSSRLDERQAPRELLPLVRAFNGVLDRLASELARRRRLVADVAHELRTPLAVLSLRLDGLPQGPGRNELQRVVTRLTHMVAQMLDVERLSLTGRRLDRIDLVALTRDVVAEIAPMAVAAGYELSLEAPAQSVIVNGDEQALSRAIANLVGNSVAHGGGKGQIVVTVGEWRILEVRDEGPGVAASLRSTLFEPFCRERPDRDGCGLGLHLVREIMRAHGGDARLVDAPRGAAFRLEFPAPKV